MTEEKKWNQKLVLWKDLQNWQPLVRLTKKKKKTQISKIINESGDVINFTEIKRMVRQYSEQLYTNK